MSLPLHRDVRWRTLSPGFVWRLQDESGNATGIRTTPDPLFAVNMSVWENAEALFAFVYRSAHAPVVARRREFFQPATLEARSFRTELRCIYLQERAARGPRCSVID
jgi:hypothetical protein